MSALLAVSYRVVFAPSGDIDSEAGSGACSDANAIHEVASMIVVS